MASNLYTIYNQVVADRAWFNEIAAAGVQRGHKLSIADQPYWSYGSNSSAMGRVTQSVSRTAAKWLLQRKTEAHSVADAINTRLTASASNITQAVAYANRLQDADARDPLIEELIGLREAMLAASGNLAVQSQTYADDAASWTEYNSTAYQSLQQEAKPAYYTAQSEEFTRLAARTQAVAESIPQVFQAPAVHGAPAPLAIVPPASPVVASSSSAASSAPLQVTPPPAPPPLLALPPLVVPNAAAASVWASGAQAEDHLQAIRNGAQLRSAAARELPQQPVKAMDPQEAMLQQLAKKVVARREGVAGGEESADDVSQSWSSSDEDE